MEIRKNKRAETKADFIYFLPGNNKQMYYLNTEDKEWNISGKYYLLRKFCGNLHK